MSPKKNGSKLAVDSEIEDNKRKNNSKFWKSCLFFHCDPNLVFLSFAGSDSRNMSRDGFESLSILRLYNEQVAFHLVH